MSTAQHGPDYRATVLLLVLAVFLVGGCRRSEVTAWEARLVDGSVLDSTLNERHAAIRDSVQHRAEVRDSLWEISPRRQPQPDIGVRWTGQKPNIRREIVRGDTLYWITMDPYLINASDSTVRVTHFRHLPLPVCRAYYRGRLVKTYDYESVRTIRTSSSLLPDRPFRFKYGRCSIRIEGPGTYVIVAEARLFYQLSKVERRIVGRAYDNQSERTAIKFEREMQATVPLFVASDPVIVEVRPTRPEP